MWKFFHNNGGDDRSRYKSEMDIEREAADNY